MKTMKADQRNLTPVRETPGWSPGSWLHKPAVQQPTYPDLEALGQALAQLSELPPLVTSWEVLALKRKLADAAEAAVSCCKVATVRRVSPTAIPR
jgi:3-deoxy-7-phosphoheptulonate synthase